MSKLPSVSAQKAIKVFKKLDYQQVRQRGSHISLHHSDKQPLSVPNHRVLGRGLLRKLIREAEISPAEFIKLLKK